MQFKCNSCGEVVDVDRNGAAGSADVTDDGSPPAGWRGIYTIIEEHDGDGGSSRQASTVLHSCADCNVHMDVDEHLEAEFEARKLRMGDKS